MDVKFAVHNPHAIPIVRQVMDGTTAVSAEVQGFEVELQTVDGLSGTLKLRCTGEAAKTARALFTEGAAITATFAAGPQEPVAA